MDYKIPLDAHKPMGCPVGFMMFMGYPIRQPMGRPMGRLMDFMGYLMDVLLELKYCGTSHGLSHGSKTGLCDVPLESQTCASVVR